MLLSFHQISYFKLFEKKNLSILFFQQSVLLLNKTVNKTCLVFFCYTDTDGYTVSDLFNVVSRSIGRRNLNQVLPSLRQVSCSLDNSTL